MVRAEAMSLTSVEFSRLILEQIDAVDRFARTLARKSADAEDLVQETYLRALNARDSFQLRDGGVRPWLFRILHNLYRNRMAREIKQPRAVETEELEALGSEDQTLVSMGVGSITDHRLEEAMKQLPEDLRAILNLWAVDELQYQEIAEVMEIPIGTVMSRLHRARKKVMELMKRE